MLIMHTIMKDIQNRNSIVMRKADSSDAIGIVTLYNEVYKGKYSDKNLSDFNLVKKELSKKHSILFVAACDDKIVACLNMKYDEGNELVKASAAVVDPSFRGDNLTEKLITEGLNYIRKLNKNISLVYSTTRTVNAAAQILTQNLGFKKLGVFPNVHKTVEYETHTLAAILYNDIFTKRYVDFKLHPSITDLFNIVKDECGLPALETAKSWVEKQYDGIVPALEFVDAKNYVKTKYNNRKSHDDIDLGFFPFHEPTTLITSADSNIEVYLYVNEVDMHSVVTGVKIDKEVSFSKLFKKISHMLRDRGVRYIEMIIRANRLNIIDKVINSKFIPCGYIPSFQKENNIRYDYVAFSRSFEILDFENLSFQGVNKRYVDEYIKSWSKIAFGNID